MRKIIFAFSFLSIPFYLKGQTAEQNVTYAATIGTGISMNEPSYTPFMLQVLGYYPVNQRFSAGVGTGLSLYETMLIPVFADIQLALTQPRKFTPYVECGNGYAFAPNKNANGGFYFNAAIGIQYALPNKMRFQLAAGYELQQLERLKEYENEYFNSSFAEKLSHHSLSVKVGMVF